MIFEIDCLSSINPINEIGKQTKGTYQPYKEEKIVEINEKIIPAPDGKGFICELLRFGEHNKYLLNKGNKEFIRK